MMETGCSNSRGGLRALIIITILPWLLVLFMAKDSLAYGVYVENNLIGYVKDKRLAVDVRDEMIQDIDNDKDIDKLDTLDFKMLFAEDGVINSIQDIKQSMINLINPDMKCYKLESMGKVIGIVQDKEIADNIVNRVADYYIDKCGFTKDKVTNISLKGNVKLDEIHAKADEIQDEESLFNKIIDENKKNNNSIVQIEIEGHETQYEDINMPTVIHSSNDLFMGQEKVESEGKSGQKEVVKSIIMVNDNKVDEKVVSSSIVLNPEDRVVVRGTKNPINSDVAFLYPPSRGAVTSGFGMRWGRRHNGIDIAANIGDPVKAALDGRVIYSGWMNGYGNLVQISHENNIVTYYGHCSKLNCKVGDKVSKGQVIAYAGSTGNSTGPHIHFEVRNNGVPIDPSKYIIK